MKKTEVYSTSPGNQLLRMEKKWTIEKKRLSIITILLYISKYFLQDIEKAGPTSPVSMVLLCFFQQNQTQFNSFISSIKLVMEEIVSYIEMRFFRSWVLIFQTVSNFILGKQLENLHRP